MFEQELNEQIQRDAEAAAKAERANSDAPEELFSHYEIKTWDFGPYLYKVVAASVVINLVGFLVLAQSDFTKRGCDSPFVGRVCQVLDTVYVGAALFGTEREYADVAYEKSELEDADITFVDVSGEVPPLSYPEGYFQIANPIQYAMLKQQADAGMQIPGVPGFTPNPSVGNDLRNANPVIPKVNPNPLDGKVPDSPFKFEDDEPTTVKGKTPAGGKGKNGKGENGETAKNDTDPKDDQTAKTEGTPDPNDVSVMDKNGVFINKRPLKDFGTETLEKLAQKEITLETPFKVVIAGKLGLAKDKQTVKMLNPKLVPDKSGKKNDPEMEKLAQDAILAVSDAGWFGYLYQQNVRNVVITLEQNDTEFVVNVQSDQPSEVDAKRAASGLNGLLALSMPTLKPDEKEFLSRAELSSQGKTFQIKFNIPKPLVQELIKRKLDEARQDGNNNPGNTGLLKPNDNTAVR